MPLQFAAINRNTKVLEALASAGRTILPADNDFVRKLRRFVRVVSCPKLHRNKWCGFLHCGQFPAQHSFGSTWLGWKHLKQRDCAWRSLFRLMIDFEQLYVRCSVEKQIWHGRLVMLNSRIEVLCRPLRAGWHGPRWRKACSRSLRYCSARAVSLELSDESLPKSK